MFRRKLWGTLLLSIPTVVWSPMIQSWFGYTAPGGATAQRWIPALFGSLVFGYGGLVFLRGAAAELRARRPGMMTLISLAIAVAFGFSIAVTLGFPGMDLWWELATLISIMVLGHWIEMRSIDQAHGALRELAKLLPDTAVRIAGERTEEIRVDELEEGDLVLVRPGAGIPADEERGVRIPEAHRFEALPGRGVEAEVDGRTLRLGGPALLRELAADGVDVAAAAIDRAAGRGQAAITMLDGADPIAVFAVADAVRTESRAAVQRLHEQGIEVIMMTGDARAVAAAVGQELGIDTVGAGALGGRAPSGGRCGPDVGEHRHGRGQCSAPAPRGALITRGGGADWPRVPRSLRRRR